MTIGLLSELLRKNDDNFTWLSLTNNDIGINIPEFTEALLKNVSLRKVSCHAGFLGSLNEEDLELLMKAFGQLPHLEDLWVALPPKQAHMSATVLQMLLERNVDNNDTSNGKKSHLSKLTIRGIDDEGCRVLGRTLSGDPEQVACSITDLQIRGTAASTSNLGDRLQSQVTSEGILSIAKMLQVNRSLERLDMSYKGLDDASLQATAQALSVNPKLQKLELNCPNKNANNKEALTSGGYQAVVDTMRHNYNVQYLTISPILEEDNSNSNHKYMMELLAKLNRTGDRSLMRNTIDHTGLEDVLEMVQDHSSDATALIELLQLNPSLWDPAKANTAGLNKNSPSRKMLKMNKASTASNKRSSFVKPPSDKVTSACASTIAQVAQRSSSSVAMNRINSKTNQAVNISSNLPVKRRSSLDKPVMARWNEDIFSKLEEEKRQNYKRWTPTVIEKGDSSYDSLPAAELTSASEEESGSESENNAPPPEPEAPQKKRPWKKRSTAIISYDVPAVVATPPQKPAVAKPAPSAATKRHGTESIPDKQGYGESLDEKKPAAVKRECTVAAGACGSNVNASAATATVKSEAVAKKPESKKPASRRRGPVEISYDVPAIVASAPSSANSPRAFLRRANNVARNEPPSEAPFAKETDSVTKTKAGYIRPSLKRDESIHRFWIKGTQDDTAVGSLSASLPSVKTEKVDLESTNDTPMVASSPLGSGGKYSALTMTGMVSIGSAMLKSFGIRRNNSL
mgnify:CR=1 FL=1